MNRRDFLKSLTALTVAPTALLCGGKPEIPKVKKAIDTTSKSLTKAGEATEKTALTIKNLTLHMVAAKDIQTGDMVYVESGRAVPVPSGTKIDELIILGVAKHSSCRGGRVVVQIGGKYV